MDMTDAKNWMKKSLLGSTTMPMGTGGPPLKDILPFTILDGGEAEHQCCGHDHHHHHHHDDHDDDCTNPKGCCG
jgi:hypothetical protein